MFKKFKIPNVGSTPKSMHRLLSHRDLRRSLGAIAVATTGVAILNALDASERKEVARRTTKLVKGDADREVTETYRTGDKKTVTIKASPGQPAESFKDDPSLSELGPNAEPSSETNNGDKPISNGDPASKKPGLVAEPSPLALDPEKKKIEDEEKVRLAELPTGTTCRKVETTLQPTAGNSGEPTPQATTNVAIICRANDGEWKQARQ